MAVSSINLVPVDFETIKENLKTYLRSQTSFKDMDFEASNINVLLDVLAYNTFHNSFYLNMVANEMFIDSAQLSNSVTSHAKALNYVPRSYRSSEAVVDITIQPQYPYPQSVLIPKGFSFSTRANDTVFSFTVNQNIIVPNINDTFTVADVSLFEGPYLSETFSYTPSSSRFVISNPNIDTTSLTVVVVEGSTATTFIKAESFVGVGGADAVFFLQAAENGQYEIIFGDGVFGRQPLNGSVVVIDYRVSKGQLANGAAFFEADGKINGASVSATTKSVAAGGDVPDTIEDVRFYAPRYFATQGRAVVTSDYETLLKSQFPEINDVVVYGGDLVDPPQYGRVFISVDLKTADGVTNAAKSKFEQFIQGKCPLTTIPVFVDPDFVYLHVVAEVIYDGRATTKQPSDISTLAQFAVEQYNTLSLNGFNRSFYASRVSAAINAADSSILTSGIKVFPYRFVTMNAGDQNSFVVNFNSKLDIRSASLLSQTTTVHYCVFSTPFVLDGKTVRLEDDGVGNIRVVPVGATTNDFSNESIVGSVDYDTGEISVANLQISDLPYDSPFKIYVTPFGYDFSATKQTFLSIGEIEISAIPKMSNA